MRTSSDESASPGGRRWRPRDRARGSARRGSGCSRRESRRREIHAIRAEGRTERSACGAAVRPLRAPASSRAARCPAARHRSGGGGAWTRTRRDSSAKRRAVGRSRRGMTGACAGPYPPEEEGRRLGERTFTRRKPAETSLSHGAQKPTTSEREWREPSRRSSGPRDVLLFQRARLRSDRGPSGRRRGSPGGVSGSRLGVGPGPRRRVVPNARHADDPSATRRSEPATRRRACTGRRPSDAARHSP